MATKKSALQGTMTQSPDSSHTAAFSSVLRDIARSSYQDRMKKGSKDTALAGADAKPSDVSGGTYASVMGNLESMTGGDISKEYAATMDSYKAQQSYTIEQQKLAEQKVNDLHDNQYKDLQSAKVKSDLGIQQIFIPAGTLAYRNNNPGNLRYVGQPGASLGEGGFARFDTPEAGYEALKRQVSLDQSRNLTVSQFISKYAPPRENDTALYIAQFTQSLGVDVNTNLSELSLDEVAQFMAKKESSTQVLGGGESAQNDQLDYWASQVFGGMDISKIPGYGTNSLRKKVMDYMPQYAKDHSIDANLGQLQIEVAGKKVNYDALQRQDAQITAFEGTAKKNLLNFLDLAGQVDDTGSPILNKYLRASEKDIMGDPKLSAFDAARKTATNEISRVLSGSMGGVLSDSARSEASDLLGPNATAEQISQASNILIKDMANRKETIEQALHDSLTKQYQSVQPVQQSTGGTPSQSDPLGLFP